MGKALNQTERYLNSLKKEEEKKEEATFKEVLETTKEVFASVKTTMDSMQDVLTTINTPVKEKEGDEE